jgi:hypothetical protein
MTESKSKNEKKTEGERNKKSKTPGKRGRRTDGKYFIYEKAMKGSQFPGQYFLNENKEKTEQVKTLDGDKAGKRKLALFFDAVAFSKIWMKAQDKEGSIQDVHKHFYWTTTDELEARRIEVNEALVTIHKKLSSQLELWVQGQEEDAIPAECLQLAPLPWDEGFRNRRAKKSDEQKLYELYKERMEKIKAKREKQEEEARTTQEVDRSLLGL